MYSYVFKQSVFKDLQKLPKHIQRKILTKLDFFVSCSNPLLFAHHLINSDFGQYRFSIGDYLVVFNVDGETITILYVIN